MTAHVVEISIKVRNLLYFGGFKKNNTITFGIAFLSCCIHFAHLVVVTVPQNS